MNALRHNANITNILRRVTINKRELSSQNFHTTPLHDKKIVKRRTLPSNNNNNVKFDGIRKMSSAATSSKTRHKNRLALEKSPYLLQHATNPVDWYPWGEEAFEKAQKEDKLIFLSVGYATCHWCHVMEKESFEDEETAALMNKYFVNVKVDREERPDVDKLYMSFIQATVGGGGWPMTVFLTPDLKPLTGGTYFPPVETRNIPSLKSVLKNMERQWRNKEGPIMNMARRSLDILKRVNEQETNSAAKVATPDEKSIQKCFKQFVRSYDEDYGGFSTAPKFPQPSNFNFLFHFYSIDKESEDGLKALEMCLTTLKRIAYGGIHDHVNSGFARYSVDRKWHVPHFEKMLYDNAQLAVNYCDAYVITKDEFYAEIVHDILSYVMRDLSHELGGFFGAQDADSYPEHGVREKSEGAFCVWEYCELEKLLKHNPSTFEVFCYHYNVTKDGNVPAQYDSHGELLNKNILCCFGSYEQTAIKFGLTVKSLKEMLKETHEILAKKRAKRPPPITDTKMVTSWQGLMLSGFSKAGFALKEQKYINRAIRAAKFIKKYSYDEETQTLFRCCYGGEKDEVVQTHNPIKGFLDDYAFLIRGLLDLYEASLDSDWLQWAEILQETQDKLFWDPVGMGYFTSPEGDTSIRVRGKEDQDGAEPCGNSVSVHNLLRLSAYLDRHDLKVKAGKTLALFEERLSNIPVALPEMMSALLLHLNSLTQIFIATETDDSLPEVLLDVVRTKYIPGRVLAVADGPGGRAGILYKRHESLSKLKTVAGRPAAYVCRNFTCSLPVTEASELSESLDLGGKIGKSDDNLAFDLNAFKALSTKDASNKTGSNK